MSQYINELKKVGMNFKKWVKSIQTAGYNGARTVYRIDNWIHITYIYKNITPSM